MANRMPRIASSRVFFLNVGRGAAWWNGVRKGVKLLMIVCRFCLFLLSYRIGGGLHAECRGRSCFLSRIIESFSREELLVTRRITDGHGCLSWIFFFITNYRINTFNHTENRGRSRIFVSNCFFTRSVAEGHGFYHELSNYRINTFNHTESRGRSRIFLHTECWECGGVGDEEVWVLVLVCDS